MLSTAGSYQKIPFLKNKLLLGATAVFAIVWLSTLIGTSNLSNWLMENVLVILFLGFLAYTYRIFNFSGISYLLICLYLCLHIYGSKYTYAENPFGYWLKDQFHFQRNHYDRIVHFSFGFMLAYPMRDYFLNRMKFPNWVGWVLPVEITLSFSCLYEIIEWAVADVFFPEQGDAYLGTQGDIWDAQKDMFMAFCGAVIILLIVATIKKIFKKSNTYPEKKA
jgi:putative membrane protein